MPCRKQVSPRNMHTGDSTLIGVPGAKLPAVCRRIIGRTKPRIVQSYDKFPSTSEVTRRILTVYVPFGPYRQGRRSASPLYTSFRNSEQRRSSHPQVSVSRIARHYGLCAFMLIEISGYTTPSSRRRSSNKSILRQLSSSSFSLKSVAYERLQVEEM